METNNRRRRRPGPSALRRTAARLRSGAIGPVDPQVSPLDLAEAIERAIAEEQFLLPLAVRSARSADG